MIDSTGEALRKALTDSISLPAFILFFTMMGFGSFARSAGFGWDMVAASVIFIWGLPGQLAMAELTATGQPLLAIIFACSLANARFLPMTVAFLPQVRRSDDGLGKLALLAQLLSINSWAMCMREFPRIAHHQRQRYYVGFALSILIAALLGALIGYHGSGWLPEPLILGLVFSSPLFFALVLSGVPTISHRVAMLAGCALIPLMHHWLPSVDLLLTGLIGGTLAWLFGRSRQS